MKGIKDKVDALKNIRDIQGTKGNWDYGPYMHGMYNGLEMALSIFEDREPVFKNAPQKWGQDMLGNRRYLVCA